MPLPESSGTGREQSGAKADGKYLRHIHYVTAYSDDSDHGCNSLFQQVKSWLIQIYLLIHKISFVIYLAIHFSSVSKRLNISYKFFHRLIAYLAILVRGGLAALRALALGFTLFSSLPPPLLPCLSFLLLSSFLPYLSVSLSPSFT